MRLLLPFLYLLGFLLLVAPLRGQPVTSVSLLNDRDNARLPVLRERSADWRNGCIVYQVLVDRFAPSPGLEKKKRLYAAPRSLKAWSETPKKGVYVPEAHVWSHEIEFWGGDLKSLSQKLDYLHELGVDVLYLNPIFSSFTNHKYDAWDYTKVDPALGTRRELGELTRTLHDRGMRLVLDGVFNHMGRFGPRFQEAQKNPRSPWRKFFQFKKAEGPDYIGWLDVENLPELNLEHPEVRDAIWAKPDSVIQSYLRQEEIDGWRLDVAFDLGFHWLTDLTRCAHTARPGSVVIGEIWNYPEEWHPAVDGVMNMHGRKILLKMLEGKVSGPMGATMWDTLIADSGLDHILKTWLVLDNHDTPRLPNLLPKDWQQTMARVLQFTLPGSVCLYYGSELGMAGGEDPEQRAPMRWDLVTATNPMLALHRRLIALRKREPALRYGDFRRIHSETLFAFLRRTIAAAESIVVLANPTARQVTEFLQLRESKFQDCSVLRDQFSDAAFTVFSGSIEVTIPAHGFMVLKADTAPSAKGYSRYDRIP